MKTKHVQEAILHILKKHLGASVYPPIQLRHHLVRDLHLSHSEISLLLFEIEHHFQVLLPDELVRDKFLTVEDLVHNVSVSI